MSTQSIKTTARAGVQSYRVPLDIAVSAVTVNGSAATFTLANGVITISSPTLAGGEALAFSGTETPTVPVYSASNNGGGGAVSVADGADVTQGSAGDSATTNTVMGRLTAIKNYLAAKLGITAADGDIATLGTTTDPATATSVVGLLKAGLAALLAATPAGTNVIGGFFGSSANAAADDGSNPVKIGAVFNTALPTFTNGQRGNLQMNAKGAVFSALTDATGTPATVQAGSSDGLATSTVGLAVQNLSRIFNGSTWDRVRSATSAKDTTGTGLQGAGLLGWDSVNSLFRAIATDVVGRLITSNAFWYTEASALAVGASGTFSGTSRSTGTSTGNPSGFGYFQVTILSNQAGTLSIYSTTLGGVAATVAVVANTPVTLKVPAFGGQFNAYFANGATAATINVVDGFTAA